MGDMASKGTHAGSIDAEVFCGVQGSLSVAPSSRADGPVVRGWGWVAADRRVA
jgi:hypothetical protein